MSHPLTFHWPKQAIWSRPKQWTREDYSSDSGSGMQSNMAMAVFVYNPVTGVKEWGQESSPLQSYSPTEVVFLLLQKPSSISEWRRPILNVAPYLSDFLQNLFCNQPFIFIQLCFHCHFSKQITASQRSHGFCVCSISVDEKCFTGSELFWFVCAPPASFLPTRVTLQFLPIAFFFISTLHQFHHCAVPWPQCLALTDFLIPSWSLVGNGSRH